MRLLLLFAAALLAGCGSMVENSDVPAGVYFAGRPTITDPSGVQIVETGPPISTRARRVSGTSCMNKVWDKLPEESNAIVLMKRQAAEMGYNAVHSVKVTEDRMPFYKNCWASITARGIGFKQ